MEDESQPLSVMAEAYLRAEKVLALCGIMTNDEPIE